jgi:hypothetical protein
MDPGTLAAILTIGTIVVGAATGVTGHLLGRRAASGKVGTSEASVLWAQAQEMRGMLLERLNRAEEQRDRLIEAYTTQIFPMLSSINQLVQDISATVEGGEHAVPDAQAPGRR